MSGREKLRAAKTVIFKVGSSLLADDGNQLDVEYIRRLCDQLCGLISAGAAVVLVSSGAVVAGMSRLRWSARPSELRDLQVAAAVGQMCLADHYAEAFAQRGLGCAQVLLTAEDMSNRKLYLNSRTLLKRMCELGVVPVVNENDAVALEGLRFGDNDRVAAMIANLIEADLLVILTDQEGLLDHSGEVVGEAHAEDASLRGYCREGSSLHGSGGMGSKLDAAEIASRSATHTVIMSGRDPGLIPAAVAGEPVGTFLYSREARLNARKRWFAHGSSISGRVDIDDGAVDAITANGKSLLPIGVRSHSGEFQRGDVIECFSLGAGKLVAQGVSNFSSKEVGMILGKPSRELRAILGYDVEPELIHRDNMAVI